MRRMKAVVKREYLTRVRKRTFIISTLAMPLIILAVTGLPILLMSLKSEKPKEISIIDQTDKLFPGLKAALKDTTKGGLSLYRLSQVAVPLGELSTVRRKLTEEVNKGKLDGYLVVPSDVFGKNQVQFYARNVSNFRVNDDLERAVSQTVSHFRLSNSGLDPEKVKKLVKGVELQTFKVTAGGNEEEDSGATFMITYILVFFLYMSLLIYGMMVMRGVIEEKSSRVVEMIVSAIKPFQLMAGKVLGVGGVGLTQFLIWSLLVGGFSLYGRNLVSSFAGRLGPLSIPGIPISLLLYFILYFLLGYFLYATIYAGVGAMVNSEEEAQHLQMPLTMLLVIPFMLMFYVIGNPNSGLAVLLSFIPLFTPIIMFTRIAVQTPPLWQIGLSLVLLGLAIWVMVWIVSKIYRVGILMYGKRPSLPELVKWFRYG